MPISLPSIHDASGDGNILQSSYATVRLNGGDVFHWLCATISSSFLKLRQSFNSSDRSLLDIRPNDEPDLFVLRARIIVRRTESIYRAGEATPDFDPQEMTETTLAGFYSTLGESALVTAASMIVWKFCPDTGVGNVCRTAIYASLAYLTRRVYKILIGLCDGVQSPPITATTTQHVGISSCFLYFSLVWLSETLY